MGKKETGFLSPNPQAIGPDTHLCRSQIEKVDRIVDDTIARTPEYKEYKEIDFTQLVQARLTTLELCGDDLGGIVLDNAHGRLENTFPSKIRNPSF